MSEKEELEPEEKEKMRKLRKRVGSLDYSITYDVITEELKFWYSEYIESTFLRKNGTRKFCLSLETSPFRTSATSVFLGFASLSSKGVLVYTTYTVHTRTYSVLYIVYSGTRVRYSTVLYRLLQYCTWYFSSTIKTRTVQY